MRPMGAAGEDNGERQGGHADERIADRAMYRCKSNLACRTGLPQRVERHVGKFPQQARRCQYCQVAYAELQARSEVQESVLTALETIPGLDSDDLIDGLDGYDAIAGLPGVSRVDDQIRDLSCP